MVKLSRYLMIVIAVIVSAIVIPEFYWTAFDKAHYSPKIYYSSILKDFVISKRTDEGVKRFDLKGNTYDRSGFEKVLPVKFYRQLILDGEMPDTINGVAIDIHELRANNYFYRIKPDEIYCPNYGLFPMFESQSGRARLEYPEDFFRINDRVEFIDTKSNELDEKKSVLFTEALKKKGCSFQPKIIAGLPTTRKSCDEGYFIVDKFDGLFHVKMIKGDPFVKRIRVPKDFKIKHIFCVDSKTKDIYCYVITEDDKIYVLNQDVYTLFKLPVDDYDSHKHQILFAGNIFNKSIEIKGGNFIKQYITDKQYNVIDKYEDSWEGRKDILAGKVFTYVFPFQITLHTKESSYVSFYADMSDGYIWLITNILLALLTVVGLIRKNRNINRNIIDVVLVVFTGIFGYLAINLFSNKFN